MKKAFHHFFNMVFKNQEEHYFKLGYRVVEILQTDTEEYVVTIQLRNKNTTFRMRPGEILAKDELVDQFSSRDIRTLTYLGYLSLNKPKYRILAQRFSTNNGEALFAIRKKGHKNIYTKTASEISNDKQILENLSAKDSRIIGYALATESINQEVEIKRALKGK